MYEGEKILNYLNKLNIEETTRLCEAVPYEHVKYYFQVNSKEFTKICPGFRVKTLKKDKVISILKLNYKKHFISSFLEKMIQRWLGEIAEEIDSQRNNNKSEFVAYVVVLAESFFAKNISAYFKLIDSDYSEETINLISDMVTEMIEINKQIEKLKRCVEEDQKTIEFLSDELNKCETSIREKSNIEKARKQLEKKNKKLNERIEECERSIDVEKKKRERSEANAASLKEKITSLKTQINNLESERTELIAEISEGKYDKKLSFEDIIPCLDLFAPSDEAAFVDSLICNFISLGIKKDFPFAEILAAFIYRCICNGKPIIINKQTTQSLVKCIANSLIGHQEYDVLSYETSISDSDIIEFLNDSGRIVLLDNFIGNYNETVILSILEQYKNKIVFLSTSFEGTVKYLSNEIFGYCTYINISSIHCFYGKSSLDEPATVFDEAVVSLNACNNVSTRQLERILTELSIPIEISANGKYYVYDEITLIGYLYFFLFPFCMNVLRINPFNYSKTIQKLVSESGKSKYRELFKKWY